MTEREKMEIISLRNQGVGYIKIANQLKLPQSTVKSFCRRNGLTGDISPSDLSPCECCGEPVKQTKGRKHKRFCSDKCRNKWWNSHMDLVNKKAVMSLTCHSCGRTFSTYGSKNRKYCCHACYISYRFGGGDNEK